MPSQWQWKGNIHIKKHFRSRIGVILLLIDVKSKEVRMLRVTLKALVGATSRKVMPLIKQSRFGGRDEFVRSEIPPIDS